MPIWGTGCITQYVWSPHADTFSSTVLKVQVENYTGFTVCMGSIRQGGANLQSRNPVHQNQGGWPLSNPKWRQGHKEQTAPTLVLADPDMTPEARPMSAQALPDGACYSTSTSNWGGGGPTGTWHSSTHPGKKNVTSCPPKPNTGRWPWAALTQDSCQSRHVRVGKGG